MSFGLAGCCGDIACDACQPYTSDVLLHFDADSLQTGFRKSEINAAYAVRYAQPGFVTALDTVRPLASANTDVADGSNISLSALARLSRSTTQSTADFTSYNYRLVLPSAARSYTISELEVRSKVEGDNCCACPTNVRRRFVLNSQPIIADGDGAASVTVLRR